MKPDIRKIAVLGAGTMGPGIAQSFAMGGYQVVMWTRSEATREKAKATLLSSLRAVKGYSGEDAEAAYGRIEFKPTVEEAVEGCDFVMETIVENADAKRALYEQLLPLVRGREVIVASNTSALNIFEVVPEALLPQMVIAHWYAPANLVPLVEVIKSESAPQEYADATLEMLEKCGKTAVPMQKFIRGYIVNRLQQCLNQECYYLINNGYCTGEDIDRASKASFIPRAMVLGLIKKLDFGGLDMTANNLRNHSYALPETDYEPACIFDLVNEGNYGIKTGKGFYDYTGQDIAALKAKRDEQLVEAFELQKAFNSDPV